MAQRLTDKLNNKDGEGALTMLEREESLAWIRDDLSGGYPLHIAAWQVRGLSCKCLQSAPCGCACTGVVIIVPARRYVSC